MNSLQSLSAYKSHNLDIYMKTSSGDEINISLSNEKSLNYNNKKTENSSSSDFSFSSSKEFSFDVNSNGIDAQDKKEIEEFMKLAKPFIDNFMKELQDENQTTPLNSFIKDINDTLSPLKEKNDDIKNYAKNEIVKMFDNSLKEVNDFKSIIKESEKFLRETLKAFDLNFKSLYA